MTRRSIAEYAGAVRARYRTARRAERSRILDEFCQTTGYHPKAAIRLLRRPRQRRAARPGRPTVYGRELVAVVVAVWEASGRLCSKRLVPFLPDLLSARERHGERSVAADLRTPLLGVAPATVDRLLAP